MNINGPQKNKSAPAISMADLLKSHNSSFIALKKGDAIKGKITKLSSSEILLDINTKTEAVVLEKDKKLLKQLLSILKVGEMVTATVLNPESDMGYPVVSLRRFIDDALWDKLNQLQSKQEKISVTVREVTKGGFLVDAEGGMSGFLPNSHIAFTQNQHELLGQTIPVVIVELNRDTHKVIFSQKAVTGDTDFKKAMEILKKGERVTITVISITSFGIFVQVPIPHTQGIVVEGLVHISEVSWDKVANIYDIFAVGQTLEAVVIGFDEEAKRIDLSIKQLTADPFGEAAKHYAVDQKVIGTIAKIMDSGVLVGLGDGDHKVEGLIRKDKIPPTITYKEGERVTATISQIDNKKRRIILVPVLLEKPIGYR